MPFGRPVQPPPEIEEAPEPEIEREQAPAPAVEIAPPKQPRRFEVSRFDPRKRRSAPPTR